MKRKIFSILFVLVLVLSFSLETALPATPAAADSAILKVNGPLIQVTADGGHYMGSYSPDGSRIVCTSGGGILVMNADGSAPQVIFGSGTRPKWGPAIDGYPDGLIALAGTGITIITPTGTSVKTIDTSHEYPPTHTTITGTHSVDWSFDGSRIAFADTAGSMGIWSIGFDETGLTQITDYSRSAYAPAWSPDGTEIACAWGPSAGKVGVFKADGSQTTPLREIGTGGDYPDWGLNNKIAYHVQSTSALYVMNSDGSNDTKVSDGPVAMVAWSPSAKRLAYINGFSNKNIFSRGFPFTRIQDAIDDANEGDTVLVYPGRYVSSLNIEVPKSGLTLKASSSDPAETTIQGPITIRADNVIVDGFTLDLGGGSLNIEKEVRPAGTDDPLSRISGVKIQHDIITRGYILPRRADNLDIIDNQIIHPDPNGIAAYGSFNNVRITGNTFSGGSDAYGSGYTWEMIYFTQNNLALSPPASLTNVQISGNTFLMPNYRPHIVDQPEDLDIASILANNSFDRTAVIDSGAALTHIIYSSIQAAIDGQSISGIANNPASPGDTVLVGLGTYDEQVVTDKAITLQGVEDTTVIRPSSIENLPQHFTIPWSGGTKEVYPIISANATSGNTTVKNLTIDGQAVTGLPGGTWLTGILYREAGGTIDNNTVYHIGVGTDSSVRGQGIVLSAIEAPVTVEVKNSRLSDYDKNGITAIGDKLTTDIHDNTVTGRGPLPEGDEVQNGILIIHDAAGTVNDNNVSDNAYITGEWGACGILFCNASGSAQGNTSTSNQMGIAAQIIEGFGGATQTVTFNGNTADAGNLDVPVISGLNAATYVDSASLTVTFDGNKLLGGAGDGISIGDLEELGAAGNVTFDIKNNTIANWDIGFDLISRPTDECAGGHNTFENNDIQVFDRVNFINVEATLENNTFDRAVTVDHPCSSLLPTIWSKIQDGIDAAVDGNTVNVAAGTYDPFLVTGLNGLTVNGIGDVIVTGALDFSTDVEMGDRFVGKTTRAVVLIDDSTVNLNNLDIEGTALVDPDTNNFGFTLIYQNSSGTVNHCTTSPNDTSSSTPEIRMYGTTGIGIWRYKSTADVNVTVKHCTIKKFGNMGITVWNGANTIIQDNKIIGQVYHEAGKEIYGINVDATFYHAPAYGDTTPEESVCMVTIDHNEIYNCDNTEDPTDPRDQAAALHLNASLEYDNAGLVTPESKVTITANDIHNNRIGIYAVHCSPENTRARNNNIESSRTYAVDSRSDVAGDSVAFDAKNNWWGTKDGSAIATMFSGNVTYSPWFGAGVTDSKSETTASGDQTVDAKTEADTTVDKKGNGTPTISVTKYASNPGSGFSGDTGSYVDVHVDNVTDVDEIVIKLYYTNAEISGLVESSLKLRWWNGNNWVDCSDSGVNTTDIAGPPTYSGYMWAKIRTNTKPSLSDLSGTVFGGRGEAPTPPSGGGGYQPPPSTTTTTTSTPTTTTTTSPTSTSTTTTPSSTTPSATTTKTTLTTKTTSTTTPTSKTSTTVITTTSKTSPTTATVSTSKTTTPTVTKTKTSTWWWWVIFIGIAAIILIVFFVVRPKKTKRY